MTECHRKLDRADTACNAFKFRCGLNGVTTVERLLCASGLDNLPHLLHKLADQMTQFGPRSIPEAAQPH